MRGLPNLNRSRQRERQGEKAFVHRPENVPNVKSLRFVLKFFYEFYHPQRVLTAIVK